MILLLLIWSVFDQIPDSTAGTQSNDFVFTFSVTDLFENEHITSIAIDNRGLSYFSVSKGILEFDGVEWRRIDVRDDARISVLKVNEEGRIFAGGREEFGFLAVDERGNTLYKSLAENVTFERSSEVVSIIPGDSSVYYVFSDRIFQYKRNAVTVLPGTGNFLAATFFDGSLFAMDEAAGLVRFDSTGTFQRMPESAGIRTRILVSMDLERILMISTSRGYFEAVPELEKKTHIRSWTGSEFGLPPGTKISSVAYTDGILAFGTLGQGIVFTDRTGTVLHRVTTEDGLFSDFVYGVTFTPRNAIWAGHDNGVSLIEASRRIPTLVISEAANTERQRMADSLHQNKIFARETWWDGFKKTMTSFFGGDTTLKKSRIQASDFASIVRRVQFIRNDSTVFGGAFSQEKLGVQDFEQSDSVKYVFEPEENALRFSFSSNSFESNGIQFQALLEGLDEEWSPWTTNNFREYTNLDFGGYTFKVRARNNLGDISKEASFRFEIDPPWHKAPWFYALQLSIYIGLLITSYFLSKNGVALGLSSKIITILVIVSFEYFNTYIGPVIDEIAGDIAIFAVAFNIILALVLDPVQKQYENLLAFLALRQKKRDAEAAERLRMQQDTAALSSEGAS